MNIIGLGSCRITTPLILLNNTKHIKLVASSNRGNNNGLGVYNTQQIINLISNENANEKIENEIIKKFIVSKKNINFKNAHYLICEISSLKILKYKNKSLDINFGSLVLKYCFGIHLDTISSKCEINEYVIDNIILFIKNSNISEFTKNKNLLRSNLNNKTNNINDLKPYLTNDEFNKLEVFIEEIKKIEYYKQSYDELKNDIEFIINNIPCKIIFVPIVTPFYNSSLKIHRETINNYIEKIIKNTNSILFKINNHIEINDEHFLKYNINHEQYEIERFGKIDYSHFNENFNRKLSNVLYNFINNTYK